MSMAPDKLARELGRFVNRVKHFDGKNKAMIELQLEAAALADEYKQMTEDQRRKFFDAFNLFGRKVIGEGKDEPVPERISWKAEEHT